MSNPLQTIGNESPPVRQRNIIPWDESLAGFNQLCAAFDAARVSCPGEYTESFYTLANQIVRLRAVGNALASTFDRAYAPHAIPVTKIAPELTNSPALSIDLWDESVTGIPYPRPIVQDDGNQSYLGNRQVKFNDVSGRWIWGEKDGMATWLDRKANRMVGWRAQGSQPPIHERSKPLSFLLPLWFYDQHIHLLHAGMVAHKGAGVLIAGGSGIGKSTTSLCCMLAGLDFLSDDQVAVTRADGASGPFVAHSIFQSARVLPDHLACFPALQPYAIISEEPFDPKVLLFLAEAFPDRVVDKATINVIVLPRLSAQAQTHVQRATRGDALNYMARTSVVMPLGIGRARFEHMLQLLTSAPCYWLDLGQDLTLIPAVIEKLLLETS